MRLEHHLVGGYVRYISPHIIIIIIIISLHTIAFLMITHFSHVRKHTQQSGPGWDQSVPKQNCPLFLKHIRPR